MGSPNEMADNIAELFDAKQKTPMNILITGASGFVGRALCTHLLLQGHGVRAAVRRPSGLAGEVRVRDISTCADWGPALNGCDAVVHLAARVHVSRDRGSDSLAAFRAVNTEATLHLARQCAASGIRRFVFLSSVKVNGEGGSVPYTEADVPAPPDPYGISKWEAELGLREIESASRMEVVCLRPPLVYGPGVKANFLKLMQIVDKGLPLPLAGVRNARSMIYIDNLVDAIALCLSSGAAAGQTFFAADDETPSTPELVRSLARVLGKKARLFPVPAAWLQAVGAITGRAATMQRLTGSFQVETSRIRTTLGWQPLFGLRQGLAETGRWYRATKKMAS